MSNVLKVLVALFACPKNILEVFCIYSGSLNITLKHLKVIVDMIHTGTVAYFLCVYAYSWKDYRIVGQIFLQSSHRYLEKALT